MDLHNYDFKIKTYANYIVIIVCVSIYIYIYNMIYTFITLFIYLFFIVNYHSYFLFKKVFITYVDHSCACDCYQ